MMPRRLSQHGIRVPQGYPEDSTREITGFPTEPLQAAKNVEWDRTKDFWNFSIGRISGSNTNARRQVTASVLPWPGTVGTAHAHDGGRANPLTVLLSTGRFFLPVIALRKHGLEFDWLVGDIAYLTDTDADATFALAPMFLGRLSIQLPRLYLHPSVRGL
jgi:hypothetical protein